MGKGYIKLYRQIKDCYLWYDKPFSRGQAWIDLLLRANHKDAKIYIDNILVLIKRGSFHTSVVKLAEEWGWSRKKTTNFLNDLAKEGMIAKKGTAKGTTITIVKYDDFQEQGAAEGTTAEQQRNTNNNDKNDKKGNIKRFQRKTDFNSIEQQDYDFELLERKGNI